MTRIPWLAAPTPEGHTFDPADPRHGTANGYNNHDCRCEPCTRAWREQHLRYMHSNPDQQEKNRVRNRRRYHSLRSQGYSAACAFRSCKRCTQGCPCPCHS